MPGTWIGGFMNKAGSGLEHSEMVQYMVYMVANKLQKKEIEKGAKEFVYGLIAIGFFLGLSVILFFWGSGIIHHPLQAIVAGLKWTLISYCLLFFVWTCRVYYQIFRKRRKGVNWVIRYQAQLRTCLFKGKCKNKRTRFHIIKNYLVWYVAGSFGKLGLGIWLQLYLLPYRVWGFIRVYWFLFSAPVRVHFGQRKAV
jgi:hypothetical protein